MFIGDSMSNEKIATEALLHCENCGSGDNARECESIDVGCKLVTAICDYCCESHQLKPKWLLLHGQKGGLVSTSLPCRQ
jgi:hypothetical protein